MSGNSRAPVNPLRRITRALIALAVGNFLGLNAWADDPLAIAERLHRAQVATSLDQKGVLPWHLKLSVKLLDLKGKTTEEGTVEEWWLAPEHWKISYTAPGLTMDEVQSGATFFRTAGTQSPPPLYDLLLRQVVHPMPLDSDIDQSRPEERKETLSKVPLECIMLDQPLKNLPSMPMGLFPTYCFDAGKDSLRISYDFGSQDIVRNCNGLFQKIFVPLDLSVSLDGVLAATGHTEALSGLPASTPEFDTSTLQPLANTTAKVAGGVMQGMILKKQQPVYPEDAKQRRVAGSVVLRAIIGRDGHVHSLRFVSVPDASLGVAAVAAVRKWLYKPYLLNGEATEVDTTITVNFEMSR